MDDVLGDPLTTWAMDNYWTAFFATWALGIVMGSLIWVFGGRWPRVWRVVSASFGAAIFLAPSLVLGEHDGLVAFPGLLTLLSQPEWGVFLISFGLTWLACAIVLIVVSFAIKLSGDRPRVPANHRSA